jgi:hypothetical protein
MHELTKPGILLNYCEQTTKDNYQVQCNQTQAQALYEICNDCQARNMEIKLPRW